MGTDPREHVTAADVSRTDPVQQPVRRGRRIGPARTVRRVVAVVIAATAVVAGLVVMRNAGGLGGPGSVELVGYQVPAFPLSFAEVPTGLAGPSLSLDASFDGIGPGPAHAGWSDPLDPTTGIGITLRADEPAPDGQDDGEATIAGADATVHRIPITGIGEDYAVVWQRTPGQWVTVHGTGRFGTRTAVVQLAGEVVDQPVAVPLQLSVAPQGWVLVAYEGDRVLTLADPSGDPATGSTAPTLSVSLPETPTDPSDLPAEVGTTGGRMKEVTVHGHPAQLLPTANGWYLQAAMTDGTVFAIQSPADLTPEQVVQVAEGVGRPQ